MESLRTKIEEALDKLVVHRRPADFQRLAFHLASLLWPELRATTLSSDLGADALIPFRDGKTKLVLACGINGDLTKLKEDCKRLSQTHRKPQEIVFATTLPVTELSEQKWREAIREEFDIGLRDVIQREWITTELEKEPNRWLCKEYLEIPLVEFQNLPAILPRIQSAAAKLLNAYKGEYQFDCQLLIDLSLEELDEKEPATDLRLSALPHRLSAGDCCSITGAPGAGKTFSLITVGSTLAELGSLIPIVVSLRALSHRGYKLLDWILSEPSFQEQGITAAELSNAASVGALLLLLNGWNEIARDEWMATTEAIASFIRQMPACALLVTSRQSLGRDFKFPAREFRVKPLSGDEIRKAIRQAGLEDADRHADFILDSAPLSEIATVPLFLQAIIREVKSGNELPLGKQAMLRRMVDQAVEEHRSALEHGDVRQHAVRYLADLAWEMTRAGRTTIPEKEAHQTISNTVHKLRNEALLGEKPAPPDILKQLIAGHLLISVSGSDVAFTHQLVQEHFAAIGIISALGDVVSNGDLEVSRKILTDYQWEPPLFLALEDLAEQHRHAEIRVLLDWFRLVDFEMACRMAGTVSDFWSEVRDLFEPAIRHLASLENVNARWLAARCAAAIGQPEFHDLVWAGLDGHPPGTSDCFEGISSGFLLRALGEGFAKKLLEFSDEEFRFRALALAGRSPSAQSLRLAETLVMQDPAPMVRRLAFQQLFVSGRRGWLRPFLRDAKRQGWSLGLLRVLKACPQCTVSRFRKFIGRYFERQTTIKERMNTLVVWEQEDASGQSAIARAEYDRLDGAASASQEDWEFRQFCLKSGASEDQQWAIPKIVREAMSPDSISRLDVRLLNILPDVERNIVVRRLLPELSRGGHTTMGVRRHLAELAPVVAADCLLRAVAKTSREFEGEEGQNLRYALNEIGHGAVVQAVLHADFAEPSPGELGRILRAINTGFPGGDPDAVRLLPEEILIAYRQRILRWLQLLPPLDKSSAFDWATCATLIGEVGHPDDAELLYKILLEDEERVRGEIETRTKAVDAYTSGKTATPPGPIDHISYGNWDIAALANIPGKHCMEIMQELLSHADHIGVASHTLAKDAGAEPIDLSGSIQSSPRFDLIYAKRSARRPLGEPASEYDAAIKRAIDLQLGQRDYRSHALFSALRALARISGPDSEFWILERLERYFPTAGAESLLETMTLAGSLLPGQRILSFVRNTITLARGEPWNNRDQTYLVTKALVSLFFSDFPELSIALLDGEVDWFLKSSQFRSLLGMLAWERSSVVEAWLKQLLSAEIEQADVRDAVLECLAKRALTRGDHSAVLDVANRLAQAGPSMDPTSSAARIICKLAGDDEGFRSLLLAQAKVAKSINEAAGWLRLISGIGTNDGVRAAFELADRFGEQLRVVSSLAPVMQEGTSLSFHGWFYFIGGIRLASALYYLSDIIEKLHEFTASPDPVMSAAAERALLWIERERILAASPRSGPRPLPPQSKGAFGIGINCRPQ